MISILLRNIHKNPLIFNAITGGILCASSDVVAQHWEKESSSSYYSYSQLGTDTDENSISTTTSITDEESSTTLASNNDPISSELSTTRIMASSSIFLSQIDWWRFIGAGCIGSVLGGCIYPAAYARLDAFWVGTHWKTVVAKSITEIATVGIFVNTISLTTRGLARGDQTIYQVLDHVGTQLVDVTKNDFLVWLPYNIIAFSFIPAIIRPTTTAAMEASWQTYISVCAHDYHTTGS